MPLRGHPVAAEYVGSRGPRGGAGVRIRNQDRLYYRVKAIYMRNLTKSLIIHRITRACPRLYDRHMYDLIWTVTTYVKTRIQPRQKQRT